MLIDATSTSLWGFGCFFMLACGVIARSPALSNPATFFASVWLIATVPAVVFALDAVTATSFWVIGAFLMSATFGSIAGERLAPSYSMGSGDAGARDATRMAVAGSAIGGVAGLSAASALVIESGHSLIELASPETWVTIAAHYSVARYHEAYVEPVLVRLLLAVMYSGALIGGLSLSSRRSRPQTLASVSPVVAGVLVTMLTTAKGAMLLTALLTLSASLAARVGLGTGRMRVGSAGVAFAAVVLAAASVVSLGLRYGPGDVDLAFDIASGIASYFVGHMAAFSAWLRWEGPWGPGGGWGRDSFAGIAEVLGLTTRSPGFYTAIPLNDIAAESNVFTAFRALIRDFTFPGALLLAMLASAVAGFSWKVSRASGLHRRSLFVLTVYYAFVGWSPIISIYIYNSIVFSVAVFALFLVVFGGVGRRAAFAPNE